MSPQVMLQNDFDDPSIPAEQLFQHWVDAIFNHLSTPLADNVKEVCIRIVNRNESATLNEQFRQKTGATNVLAFPNDIDPTLTDESIGDLAICFELVNKEANELGIAVLHHWAHLTVHGVLHLLGYDHIKPEDASVMERLEIQILNLLKIDNPYRDILND